MNGANGHGQLRSPEPSGSLSSPVPPSLSPRAESESLWQVPLGSLTSFARRSGPLWGEEPPQLGYEHLKEEAIPDNVRRAASRWQLPAEMKAQLEEPQTYVQPSANQMNDSMQWKNVQDVLSSAPQPMPNLPSEKLPFREPPPAMRLVEGSADNPGPVESQSRFGRVDTNQGLSAGARQPDAVGQGEFTNISNAQVPPASAGPAPVLKPTWEGLDAIASPRVKNLTSEEAPPPISAGAAPVSKPTWEGLDAIAAPGIKNLTSEENVPPESIQTVPYEEPIASPETTDESKVTGSSGRLSSVRRITKIDLDEPPPKVAVKKKAPPAAWQVKAQKVYDRSKHVVIALILFGCVVLATMWPSITSQSATVDQPANQSSTTDSTGGKATASAIKSGDGNTTVSTSTGAGDESQPDQAAVDDYFSSITPQIKGQLQLTGIEPFEEGGEPRRVTALVTIDQSGEITDISVRKKSSDSESKKLAKALEEAINGAKPFPSPSKLSAGVFSFKVRLIGDKIQLASKSSKK